MTPKLTDKEVQEGWIEWNGGECPVSPSGFVDVRFRDGIVSACTMARVWCGPDGLENDPLHSCWAHAGNSQDIIAYREVSQ